MYRCGGVIWVLILFVSCCHDRETVIEFSIVGASETKLELTIQGHERDVNVDETGSAKLTIKDGERGYASLKYGKDRIPLFVEEGKSLSVYIYGDKVKGNIHFEGAGAAKNSYLNSRGLKNTSFNYDLGEKAFFDQLKDQIAGQTRYLDSMNFDAAFAGMERDRIQFSTYMALENYPLYHAWSTGNTAYLPDTCYLASIKMLIREDDKLLVLKEYQEGMASLISLISTYRMKEFDAYKRMIAQVEYVINHLKSEPLIEILVDRYVYAYLMGVGIDERTDEIVKIHHAHVKDPVLKKRFDACHDRSMRIVSGQPAFDFTFTDIKGQAFRLETFRGKYLFINVWATWGAPCYRENEAWGKLIREMEHDPIVFVAVSCDHDRATWEKRVREKPRDGVQLYMGNDRAFMDFYMIRGIPRFILIDPEGRIVDADMARPSNPETVKILQAYMKQ